MENSLTKNQLEGMVLQKIDDSKAFENLSLNRKYTLENKLKFKELSEKYSIEANRLMGLVFKWSVD